METRRDKPELVIEGRKGLGQIQCRSHMNGGVEVWEHGRAGRALTSEVGWHGNVCAT